MTDPAGRRGVLHVVGTPIGNLGDLSPRAASVLSSVALIACEDTRRTGRLLQLVGIAKRPMAVVNQHTEADVIGRVLGALEAGDDVALVSDAGMPTISDPGAVLVAAVVEAGFAPVVVPGPSASLAALAVSGLVGDRFCFEGFLPRKGAERGRRIATLASDPRISVLFEAPHRVLRTVSDLAEACGSDRRVAMCRELTKLHEEVWRGSLGEAVQHLGADAPRGEYVLVLSGRAEQTVEADDDGIVAALVELTEQGTSTRDAVAEVAKRLDVPRRRVYGLAVQHFDEGQSDS